MNTVRHMIILIFAVAFYGAALQNTAYAGVVGCQCYCNGVYKSFNTSVCTADFCRQQGCGSGSSSGGGSSTGDPRQQLAIDILKWMIDDIGKTSKEAEENARIEEERRKREEEERERDARIERERAAAEAKRRNDEIYERITGSLKGIEDSGELRLKGLDDGGELQIKKGTEFFGTSGNPSSRRAVASDTNSPLPLKLGPAPKTVEGVPVNEDGTASTPLQREYKKLLEDFKQNEHNIAELKKMKEELANRRAKAERDLKAAKIRSQPPVSTPNANTAAPATSKEEDDKLKEAEKLLAEITEVDKKVSGELKQAEADMKEKKKELDTIKNKLNAEKTGAGNNQKK